ncbi:hypothetical protein [Algoriphagus sp.]|uniref:hypothetical protein n=1 Tax=Algoriphagus sp. TaxID=1872435 RepID=UPI0025DA45EC|nr:hypothetical protein [Algoriphagus sp.]
MKEAATIPSFKPFSLTQLSALSGSVWLIDRKMKVIQLNLEGRNLSKAWRGKPFSEGDSFKFKADSSNFSILVEKVKNCLLKKESSDFEFRHDAQTGEFGLWKVNIKQVNNLYPENITALVQIIDISSIEKKMIQIQEENEKLRELAIRPSHILRSPLSSILGLLELMDEDQLDEENQKYFSYLKPLAKELDDVIKSNAKKMSIFN